MKSIVKGVAVVEALAFAPYLLGVAITPVALAWNLYGLANLAFATALLWSGLMQPLRWITPPAMPSNWTIVIEVVEWAVVGVVVGSMRRNRSWPSIVGLATVAVVLVSTVVHLLIRVAGYRVILEGP